MVWRGSQAREGENGGNLPRQGGKNQGDALPPGGVRESEVTQNRMVRRGDWAEISERRRLAAPRCGCAKPRIRGELQQDADVGDGDVVAGGVLHQVHGLVGQADHLRLGGGIDRVGG